jgi:hypothetical protein
MTTPMTTNPSGVEEDEIIEFRDGKGPYGGDPYFRGPLMGPLPQYNYPPIKSHIYVSNQLPSSSTTMPTNIQPTPVNYIAYMIIAIVISIGILILLLRK